MRRLFSFTTLGCLLLAMPSPARCEDAVELRWRFTQGQVLKYRFRDYQERTVAVGTEKLETTMEWDYEWEWKVQEVGPDGDATLEHRFTALKLRHSSKDFELEYDSSRANDSLDDDKKNAMQFFDQLRLSTYRVKLGADGRIAEVYGLDKLIGETTAGSNTAEFHAVHLHDASFAWLVQQTLGSLPAKAVTAGATWKTTAPESLIGLGTLKGHTEIALGKPMKIGASDCRELEGKGSHTLDLDMKFGTGNFTGPLKTQKMSSKVLFDPKAGIVRRSDAEVELGGDLKLNLNGNAIDVKVSYRHRLELELKP